MRKIWFMLLLISSVCVFTACSDDDDNGDGDDKGKSPITELILSDEVSTGDSTTILGKGFADGDKLIVADAAGERTEIEGAVASATGMTFTLPETLASGKYSLILKRGADEWTLGEFKVVRMVEVVRVKTHRLYIPPYPGDTDPMMDATYEFTYDDYNRATSYSSSLDLEGEIMTIGYEFTWTENKLEVGGNAFDNEFTYPISYTLENGRIATSKTKEGDSEPIFDEDGEFIGMSELTIIEKEYTWNYTGEYLSSLSGAAGNFTYTFEGGNLTSIDDGSGLPMEFEYDTQKVNPTNIDILAYVLNACGTISLDRFWPYALGVAGKISKNLPNNIGVPLANMVIDQETGLPASFDIDLGYGVTTLSFTYETVRVLVD